MVVENTTQAAENAATSVPANNSAPTTAMEEKKALLEKQQQQQQQQASSADIEGNIKQLSLPEQQTVLDHAFAEHPHARTFLLAVDDSPHSQYAYDWAVEHFIRKEDKLILVNIRKFVYPQNYLHPGVGAIEYYEAVKVLDDASREECHNLLRKYGCDLKQRGYNVRAVAIRGEPREDIIAKAEDIKADAIIVGSRGLGAVKRTILGSTSDYIVHHSKIPVILVKKPQH